MTEVVTELNRQIEMFEADLETARSKRKRADEDEVRSPTRAQNTPT